MSKPVAMPETSAGEAAAANGGRLDVSEALSPYVLSAQQAGPRAADLLYMKSGVGSVDLPPLEIVRDTPNQERVQDAMKVLTTPYKPGAWMPGTPADVFEAIDGHYLNSNRNDGLIGKADIDTYLKTSGVPFMDRTVGLSDHDKAALQWLSNNWDSPEVKALRRGSPYLSIADLKAYNHTPAGQPVPDARPGDSTPVDAKPTKQPDVFSPQQRRGGIYDLKTNAESDHNDEWVKGDTKVWVDRGQGGREIGYTFKDPEGNYVGWKFNPDVEGGRWEKYNGNKFLGSAKDVRMTEKGLQVDGNPEQV